MANLRRIGSLGGLVEQRMRLGFNTIKKVDFLDAYSAART